MVIEEKYKSKHLILLVGSNPLPNLVAGRLLSAAGGEIALFCSKASDKVAKRLTKWLRCNGLQVVRQVEMDESDPVDICRKIKSHLAETKPQRIGLHYTGGTKAMSVHSWQAVHEWAKIEKLWHQTTMSYLNPRELEMIFDSRDLDSGENALRVPVGLEVKLSLKDLFDLHGLELGKRNNKPVLPATARALAEVCAEDGSFNKWKDWVRKQVESECWRQGKRAWKSKSDLSKISLEPFPDNRITDAFKSEGGLIEADLPLVQPKNNFKEPEDFCRWLHGTWLDNYVLDEIAHIADEVKLHEHAGGIETHGLKFEVDVVAIRGYQLFGISCTTDRADNMTKSKLFEAYVRMRQLGGDEARIALVCCTDDPDSVQKQMRRDLGEDGQIRVFGRKDLPQIGERLKNWIEDQSR